MKNVFLLLIGNLVCFCLFAQPGWNWPENKLDAQKNVSLYSEYLKQAESSSGNSETQCTAYKDANNFLGWLFKNCPDLNYSLYINGIKLYKGLMNCAKEASLKTAYGDSVLLMYDLRIKYYGGEANILNRKGIDAYKLHNKETEELYLLFKKIIELNGNNTYSSNLTPYMEVLCRKHKAGQITEDEILDEYDKMSQIIDFNAAKGGKAANGWEKTKEYLDKMLFSCVTVDCARIISTLGPKLEANPADVKIAKKIFHFMRTGKCTEDPLFLKASKAIYAGEPSPDVAAMIGILSVGKKEFGTAIEYLDKAVESSTDNTKKAEYSLKAAECYKYQGNKSQARAKARQALSYNAGLKDAYILIGNLYMTSSDECKADNDVASKAIFWAAYDQFAKAGSNSDMTNAKRYFPNKEEIFLTTSLGAKLGESFKVGCWIGETTTVRSKD